MIFQKEILLEPKKRGFHLITNDVISQLPDSTGIVNIFIKHTSASLTINENADPSVRFDFETHFRCCLFFAQDSWCRLLKGLLRTYMPPSAEVC